MEEKTAKAQSVKGFSVQLMTSPKTLLESAFEVKVMHNIGRNLFYWPRIEDNIWYTVDKVVTLIPPPENVTQRHVQITPRVFTSPHLLIRPTPYTCLCSPLPFSHASSSGQLSTPQVVCVEGGVAGSWQQRTRHTCSQFTSSSPQYKLGLLTTTAPDYSV
ncbi:unnamed protein product [Pleuronectes platessa]|uniref:Uncharacterized protein n=1 Tax=Pleuronectes platessa TaxID=8262 RepID=A0A9N7YR83_PLEPL|nr:unnamed protein product [Pleuronectes platessa]